MQAEKVARAASIPLEQIGVLANESMESISKIMAILISGPEDAFMREVGGLKSEVP